MTTCAHCGAEVPDGARFCRKCGQPAPEPISPETVGSRAADAWDVQQQHDSAGQSMLRIVGVFGAVGGGLGTATMLFLFAIDFFDRDSADSLEDIGQVFIGVVAIGAVLVFALLIGVLMAAIAGIYAASRATELGAAVRIAGLGSAAGHVVLVVVLSVFLLGGIGLFAATSPSDNPTPTPARSAQEIAECIELFGADSPLCAENQPDEADEADDPSDVGVDDLLKLILGVIPAGIVGATVAAIMFDRRREVNA